MNKLIGKNRRMRRRDVHRVQHPRSLFHGQDDLAISPRSNDVYVHSACSPPNGLGGWPRVMRRDVATKMGEHLHGIRPHHNPLPVEEKMQRTTTCLKAL